MTRRSSVRALAREIYCEKADAKAKAANATTATTTPTPDPSSLRFDGQAPSPRGADARGGGETSAVPAGGEITALTARVRALYEETAVPVREIARLAGVTEHTIYVRARKGGWKKRYRWGPRNDFAKANRGRRRAPTPGFAPVTGAGGRFIRRAEKGQPYAAGLKATDAPGHARGLAQCRAAEPLARAAQAEAEEEQRLAAHLAAMKDDIAALAALKRHADERSRAGAAPPRQVDVLLERALVLGADLAMRRWEGLLAQDDAAQRGAMGKS